MKKNLKLAHAPHCYWHKHTFYLQERAPIGTKISDWKGMPETTTSNASDLWDLKWRDQQERDAAPSAEARRREEMARRRVLAASVVIKTEEEGEG
jgi:hypothetical protein